MFTPTMKARFFSKKAELRDYLVLNHRQVSELWIGFYKRSSGMPSITYREALDEALCFGWIDGVRKSIDPTAYAIRFTPRKAKSQWSAVNIERVRELRKLRRMPTAGLKAFERAENQPRAYSYEQRNSANFQPEMKRRFRTNAPAWRFFQSQPPWYQRTSTWWVVSAKKQETQQHRLEQLIADSAQGQRIKPLRRSPPVPKRKIKQ